MNQLGVKQMTFHNMGKPHPISWQPQEKKRLRAPEREGIQPADSLGTQATTSTFWGICKCQLGLQTWTYQLPQSYELLP